MDRIFFQFSESDLKLSIDIGFGDIFWTDLLQNHGYIGNFAWTQLCVHSVNFYVLIRDRY